MVSTESVTTTIDSNVHRRSAHTPGEKLQGGVLDPALLLKSLPAIIPAALRGKVSPKIAMFGHKLAPDDMAAVKKIFAKVEGRDQRIELNLYVSGDDKDDDDPTPAVAVGADGAPADKSPTFPGPGEASESASSESES